jgi:hypothetical protein
MKKLIFTLAVPALLFSCGGGDDYCGCAKEAMQMSKDSAGDKDKMTAASEKGQECLKMLEGKSAEEVAEMSKGCTDALKGLK